MNRQTMLNELAQNYTDAMSPDDRLEMVLDNNYKCLSGLSDEALAEEYKDKIEHAFETTSSIPSLSS